MRVLYRLRFMLREGMLGLWRNRQRTILRTTVSAVALALFGLMLTVHLNLGHIAGQMENQVELEIYLRDDITASQVETLVDQITSAPGVAQYRYISKADAITVAQEMFRDSPALLETITPEQNPLPASFLVTMATPQQVTAVADLVRDLPGVEQLRYGQEDIDQLFSLTAGLRVAGLGMTVFLAVVVCIFMSSIIEAVVESYAPEIRSMYGMGASLLQVLSPFLVQGLLLGLVSSGIAIGSTFWLYQSLHDAAARDLAFVPVLPVNSLVPTVTKWLLAAGLGIGFLTSGISAYRQIAIPRSYRQIKTSQQKKGQMAKAAAARGR